MKYSKCYKCASLSLHCTFGVWRVAKGTRFITYQEDISIKSELPLEHHQVLLSSLACIRRAESKGLLTLSSHAHTLRVAKQTYICCLMQPNVLMLYIACAHMPHTSFAQWGISIQLAWLLIKACTERKAATGGGGPKGGVCWVGSGPWTHCSKRWLGCMADTPIYALWTIRNDRVACILRIMHWYS